MGGIGLVLEEQVLVWEKRALGGDLHVRSGLVQLIDHVLGNGDLAKAGVELGELHLLHVVVLGD